MVSVPEEPRLLSLVAGRMRIHLPGWAEAQRAQVEDVMGRLLGVRAVEANPVTGNVLILFDTGAVGPPALWRVARNAWEQAMAGWQQAERPGPSAGAKSPLASPLLRVGVHAVVGHAVIDALWFTAGLLGTSLGLPLAGLGPLHLLLDVAVWGTALKSARGGQRLAGAAG